MTELELIKSKLNKYEPDLIIMYDGWNDLSADNSIKKTVNNYELICQDAINNNFELIMTIQPIAGFGEKPLTLQEKINSITGQDHNGFQLIQASSTYDYLVREMMILDDVVERKFNGVCSVNDVHDIFDTVSGPIYWDQGHVMHAGNLILAEKFFELSMKKINPSFISDHKFKEIISDYNSIPVLTFLFNEVGISDQTFQDEEKDTTKLESEKGKYFELKNEFGDISKSFVGKDLRDVNLEKLNLVGQDLTGADLSGQDLRNINLSQIIIRGANLSYANLEGMNLSKMDLRGINFSNAKLKDVDFTGAIFSKTIQVEGDCTDENPITNFIKNFSCTVEIIDNESIRTSFENADLTNTKFGKSVGEPLNQMIYFANFKNADLTNATVNSAQFFGCDFTNSKLDGISIKQMFSVKSDFTNAEMKNFEISETWFQSTSFHNTNMINGVFNFITLINLDFSETDLRGTEFSSVDVAGNNNFSCKNNSICDNE